MTIHPLRTQRRTRVRQGVALMTPCWRLARSLLVASLCLAPLVNHSQAAEPDAIRQAAEKSLALLQECGPKFFSSSGCVACHQQSVTSLAVAEAKQRGLAYDAQTAREQTQITALTVKTYRDRFLERVDHPAGSAPSTGYIALGLAAEGYAPDEITDAMIFELAGRQHTDGSWTAFGHRPPMEYSRISGTALAIRAMQLYGPPGMKPQLAQRIERALTWLRAAKAESNSDRAFRLLGLAWAGGEQLEVRAEANALLGQQREDGGWSQLPTMNSDAYATGLTLYALNTSNQLPANDPSYERGLSFLVSNQEADGSWHVKSRSFPFQPYFESGFPHGHDQWISAMATGFSAVALMRALPTAERPAR